MTMEKVVGCLWAEWPVGFKYAAWPTNLSAPPVGQFPISANNKGLNFFVEQIKKEFRQAGGILASCLMSFTRC